MKMSSEEKLKQRAIIQFCVGLGHTPVQTMQMLNRSTKKPSVAWSLAIGNKWHKLYSEGRETIMDDDRCCRPVSKSKASDFKLVKHRLDVDRRITMHEICSKLKDELKGKHFNDLDELRSESTRILYSYPVEWFEQVYRQWIERHCKVRTLRRTDVGTTSFEILTCGTSLYMATVNCL